MIGSVGVGAHHDERPREDLAESQGFCRASARLQSLLLFFRLVAKSGEQIAAFDGVGGVLGDLEQFGEFWSVGAAGEEGVDKRGRDDAEALQALLFLEGLVVSGLLFGEVGVALFELGEENGVFLAQNGVFVLQNGVFLAPGLGLRACQESIALMCEGRLCSSIRRGNRRAEC